MTVSPVRATAAAAAIGVATVFAAGCSSATKEATKDAASSATSMASSATSAASSAMQSATDSAGNTTLYYPDEQNAMFSIVAPSNWTVSKIAEVGEFGSLESQNGSVLQFRAQKFASEAETKAEVDAIVDSTMSFLQDNYVDIKLDDAKDVTVDGQPGAQLAGSGKDKDGNAVQFVSAMITLGPDSLAEIWAAVFPEGNNDLNEATAVLDSIKVAKP